MTTFIVFSFSLFVTFLNAICPPPITEMPVLVTWYDPARGGINCDSDCGTFADSSPVTPEAYGNVTACIPEWLGAHLTISGLGTFHCRDTGGAIVIAYNDYYDKWVIHVDVLQSHPPEWNYELRNWHLSWNPVPTQTNFSTNRTPINYTPMGFDSSCNTSARGSISSSSHSTTSGTVFSVVSYGPEPPLLYPTCQAGQMPASDSNLC